MQQPVTPKTDEEWTIHSLNIHGTHFERHCRYVIERSGWILRQPYYPVEFPVTRQGHAVERGRPSNLDLWAEWKAPNGNSSIMLPVECKKCNAELANWVFFPAPDIPACTPMVRVHQTDGRTRSSQLVTKLLRPGLTVTNEARETKADYQKAKQGDKTKTSNAAITDAATQITIATQFLMAQELRMMKRFTTNANNTPPPHMQQVFLPTIVTTAHLFTCDFQDADVDLETGEISLSKASLSRHSYLLYNYPVPYALQYPAEPETREMFEQQAYLPILVIESVAFPDVLQKLKRLEVFGNAVDMYIMPGVQQ